MDEQSDESTNKEVIGTVGLIVESGIEKLVYMRLTKKHRELIPETK